MSDAGSDVIPLNRWRAVLARARQPRRRLELLLADPAAPIVVPQIPEEEFYYLAKGVGAADIGELLLLAAPEQVRTCLDFDVWDHDRIALDRLQPWCEALGRLDAGRLGAVLRELDVELLSLIFHQTTVIDEQDPDAGPERVRKGRRFETPDGFFLVDFAPVENRELARVLERFLERLYAADGDLARHVLLEARVGLVSELSEESYRWRSSRLADLGFIAPEEAAEVYRPLDPGTVRPAPLAPPVAATEATGLPAVFADTLGDDGFLGRTLAGIDDASRLERTTGALVLLLNRVLSADQVDPSDLDAVTAATARARDTLSLGLEHLADGDVERAVGTLDGVPLPTVFRTGFSLLLPLQRRARALRDAGNDDPDLLPLLAPRPEFPRALDDEPRAGQRPFRTRDDLRRAAARLDALAAPSR